MTPRAARRAGGMVARLTAVRQLPGVRAGSAMAWHGTRLLLVQDDAWSLALVDPADGSVELVALRGDGAALAKPEKPDLEALVALPDGATLILGSGSAPNRRTVIRIDTDLRPRAHDAGLLYDAIARLLGRTPNIEGAVAAGQTVHLLHRGAGRGDNPNAVLDVTLAALTAGEPTVLNACNWDLGDVAGVPLTFTDATPWPGAGYLYLAVAEDTPNAIDDGPVVGAAIGLIRPDGAWWTPLLDLDGTPCLRKAEGVALDDGGQGGYLVTDPDDPDRPAELCRFELAGAWQAGARAGGPQQSGST